VTTLGPESRGRIEALLREEVRNSADGFDRACLLYDVVRVIYDTTKMTFADRGRADTTERAGIGNVSDAALDHQEHMAAARRSRPMSAREQHQAQEQLAQLAEALSDPSEHFQREVIKPRPGDDQFVALTKLQAHKCAAIIQAWAAKGDELWRDAALNVAQYLFVLSVPDGCVIPTPQEAWSRVEELPWPPPGRSTPGGSSPYPPKGDR
jgi:hypothetical protein